jgi:predicted dehydrogenase
MIPDVHLITVDPGHFHAALVQKEMYAGVAPCVHVFAPVGPDLVQHLNRVAGFNSRSERPAAWELEVHARPDFLERMVRDRPGNVVVLSGRNRRKIDRIAASVGAGLHVLADKPWILKSGDLPRLEALLADADANGLIAFDIMTERFEITSILQRLLVNDRAVFGDPVAGSEAEPAVYMESIHYLKKTVAGVPNIRPPWFFDSEEQGEGLTDTGTHLVDLVQWTLFPEQPIDYRTEIQVLASQRWPTPVSEEDFRSVTNTAGFDRSVAGSVRAGILDYYCNTATTYTLRGIHTRLNVMWDWEAPEGSGDRHFAVYRGTRARVEVRQTRDDRYRPEVYVVPAAPAMKAQALAATRASMEAVQSLNPGVAVEDLGAELRLTIPDALRVGHEAHFAEVTATFLQYMRDRQTMPAWERPNMLAKYYVTTMGTELSRRSPASPARRLAPA